MSVYIRGLQFYTFFWNFNRNHTENDRYWQKIILLLFAKCLKCTVFSHLPFKIAKSAIMTPKIFFLKNIKMGIKKRRILCWIQICWCRLSEMPLTKVISKKPQKNAQKRNTQNSHSSLALAFFRGICLSRHQRIWNQHTILRFLYPY